MLQGSPHDTILLPISAIRTTAPNLPLSLPPFPPSFAGYSLNTAPNPTHIPLPATSDHDLLHGPAIASAVGYTPANKASGSRHKATPSNSKAQGKCKASDVSDIDSVNSGDESEVAKAKDPYGGCRPGAGNYKDDGIEELLHLVEKELPIDCNGWKCISVHYKQ